MTLAAQVPLAALTVILDGQVIVGATVSLTVTVKLHAAELPAASVTVKIFVVTPIG